MTARHRAIIAELDSIEALGLGPDADSDVIALMEEFASSPGKLGLLVDRYASSDSTHITARLAFCLHKSIFGFGARDVLPLLIASVQKSKRPFDRPETLLTTLSALRSAVSCIDAIAVDLSPLRDFLWGCLKDHSPLAQEVRSGAVEVLHELSEKNAYASVFSPHEDALILKELETISHESRSISERLKLDPSLRAFETFLEDLARRSGVELKIRESPDDARRLAERIRSRRPGA